MDAVPGHVERLNGSSRARKHARARDALRDPAAADARDRAGAAGPGRREGLRAAARLGRRDHDGRARRRCSGSTTAPSSTCAGWSCRSCRCRRCSTGATKTDTATADPGGRGTARQAPGWPAGRQPDRRAGDRHQAARPALRRGRVYWPERRYSAMGSITPIVNVPGLIKEIAEAGRTSTDRGGRVEMEFDEDERDGQSAPARADLGRRGATLIGTPVSPGTGPGGRQALRPGRPRDRGDRRPDRGAARSPRRRAGRAGRAGDRRRLRRPERPDDAHVVLLFTPAEARRLVDLMLQRLRRDRSIRGPGPPGAGRGRQLMGSSSRSCSATRSAAALVDRRRRCGSTWPRRWSTA